jgi:hypothetical protein
LRINVKDIIYCLGGTEVTNINISTHIIASQNSTSYKTTAKSPVLKLSYVFHCYFYLHRMDENDDLYKINKL